jgi:hypothetical protein
MSSPPSRIASLAGDITGPTSDGIRPWLRKPNSSRRESPESLKIGPKVKSFSPKTVNRTFLNSDDESGSDSDAAKPGSTRRAALPSEREARSSGPPCRKEAAIVTPLEPAKQSLYLFAYECIFTDRTEGKIPEPEKAANKRALEEDQAVSDEEPSSAKRRRYVEDIHPQLNCFTETVDRSSGPAQTTKPYKTPGRKRYEQKLSSDNSVILLPSGERSKGASAKKAPVSRIIAMKGKEGLAPESSPSARKTKKRAPESKFRKKVPVTVSA